MLQNALDQLSAKLAELQYFGQRPSLRGDHGNRKGEGDKWTQEKKRALR